MQVALNQLEAHLQKGLRSLYTLHGDEPLLAQEAADTIRKLAREQGYTERTSHTVAGAHFDWSEVLAAGGSLSLFADKQIVEIRIPSGKPGKDGSVALQQLAEASRDNDSTLTLVMLPRLDKMTKTGAWFGALMLLAVAAFAMGMNQPGNIDDARKQIGFLAPQNSLEVFLWVCLSATAGFCEEVLFRGYFQKQFTRLLRSRWIALVVVSILFGLGHGYEGPRRMALIAVLGLVFGVLSLVRKSLRPAMMAHTLQDTISGLLLRALR